MQSMLGILSTLKPCSHICGIWDYPIKAWSNVTQDMNIRQQIHKTRLQCMVAMEIQVKIAHFGVFSESLAMNGSHTLILIFSFRDPHLLEGV